MDEKLDEMNRENVQNELESWRVDYNDGNDEKNDEEKKEDEDKDDDEERRKNEIIRKTEKAIFNQHIGIVKSKDTAVLLGVGRSGQDKSFWIPLSLCVERTCFPLFTLTHSVTHSLTRTYIHTYIHTGTRETLRNECGLEIKDHFGWSALFFAVKSAETRVLDMILSDLKERVLVRFGRSSNKEAMMKSSRFKANFTQILNTTDVDGKTPLLIAISCGHFKVTRTLLSVGADAKIRSETGSTAISIACEKNRLDIVNELLQWYQKDSSSSSFGADGISSVRRKKQQIYELMNDKLSKTNTTPLYWAAENGNEDTLRRMLELGADVHASSTFRGLNALHVAAMSGNLEMIRTLLYFGANPLQLSISGENAATFAQNSKSPLGNSIARWLERWNDVVPKDLAKHLLNQSHVGHDEDSMSSSIQSYIKEDLKRNGQIDVWNSFTQNHLVQWTIDSALKSRYTYAKIRSTLISLSSTNAEIATKFVESLRRVMSLKEIFVWSCSLSILSDTQFIEQTRQSLEKRMFKSYSKKVFHRLRSDVDYLISSLKSGETLGEIRVKLIKLNLDILDPRSSENRVLEVDALLKWAYVAFTAHDTEERVAV